MKSYVISLHKHTALYRHATDVSKGFNGTLHCLVCHVAIENVQEGLESLSVFVAGNDVAETLSQRSDHHPSTSEVVSLQCVHEELVALGPTFIIIPAYPSCIY